MSSSLSRVHSLHKLTVDSLSQVLRRMINWEKQRTISSDGSHRKKDSSGLVGSSFQRVRCSPPPVIGEYIRHHLTRSFWQVLEFGEEDHRVVAALCDFIYTGETQVFGGPQQLVALCKLADQLDVQRLREAVITHRSTCTCWLTSLHH